MNYRIPVILTLLTLFSCGKKEEVLNPELKKYHNEPFFWMEYKIDGLLYEYRQPRENHALEKFSLPSFGFYNKGGEDLVATFRFKCDDDVYFGLHSTQGYFTNAKDYKFCPNLPLPDTLQLQDGYRLVTGKFSLNLDTVYYQASNPYCYDTFFVRFEGMAESPGDGEVDIKNGRLIFQRNIVEVMKANDFSMFLYKYSGR